MSRVAWIARVRRPASVAYGENWSQLSRSIKTRDGWKCRQCGETTGLVVHHIIPISRGGTNARINLTTLCELCHSRQPGHGHLR